MKAFSVVLADDHAMFRQGVRRILEEIPDIHIAGEARDGLELLRLLQTTRPHLVILDISMPKLRGLEACHEIRSLAPQAKILILTMHKEKEYLYQALKAGADGYLLKEDAATELLEALEALKGGRRYLSPLITGQVQDLLMHEYQGKGETWADPLTLRERQVLKLIAEGRSSKDIAQMLFISDRTVQNHRANIMRKLNIKKVTDLVRYALQKGYTS